MVDSLRPNFLSFQSNGEVLEEIHQTCKARVPGTQLFLKFTIGSLMCP